MSDGSCLTKTLSTDISVDTSVHLGGSGVTAGLPLKPSPLSIPCGCVRYGASDTHIITDLFASWNKPATMTQGADTRGCVLSRGVVETKTWSNVNFLVSLVSVVSE